MALAAPGYTAHERSARLAQVVSAPGFASAARWISSFLGWLLAAGMLLACLLRILGADGATPEVAVLSALPWILAPSLPVAGLALWRRHFVLAGAAAVALMAGAIWEGPVMWPFATAPPARPGPRLTVFDANVAQDNYDLSEIASEIKKAHPSVISLEELTPPGLASLQRTGVLGQYRWNAVRAQTGAGGMGVWSDIPTTGLRAWTLVLDQTEIDGWLHPPGVPAVRFAAVHVYAPVGYTQPTEWAADLRLLKARLAAEPRPLVVAGDFNATTDDPPFQQILGLRLQDAAVLAGKGWEMTWPRNQHLVIPYLRIDHVLISPTLTVTSYRLGNGKGSDHHPLVVTVGYRA
jgi:endonuclease/exonuclease/phosphatase family metal-dependent hydrolase